MAYLELPRKVLLCSQIEYYRFDSQLLVMSLPFKVVYANILYFVFNWLLIYSEVRSNAYFKSSRIGTSVNRLFWNYRILKTYWHEWCINRCWWNLEKSLDQKIESGWKGISVHFPKMNLLFDYISFEENHFVLKIKPFFQKSESCKNSHLSIQIS